MKPAQMCRGPVGITRRNMLQVGGIGAFNLALPNLLAARERPTPRREAAKADSCILVFLNGGPSHLDMWDMKPDLPQEMRSTFQPISSSIPGIQVCEHLPKLSRKISHCSLIRSVYHDQVAHAPAVYTALTGVKSTVRQGLLGAKPTDHPSIGSMIGSFRPPSRQISPYVLMPYLTAEGAGGPPQPGFLAGNLGSGHDPLMVQPGGPGPGSLSMPALIPAAGLNQGRVQDRRRLLDGLHQTGVPVLANPAAEMERFQAKACDLLTSSAAQGAFQLDREPGVLRDAYGRNVYGQSLLLARRLVEAGTRLACISWAPNANATWDTHGQNFTKLKNDLLPPFDLAFPTLLTDLHDRGMLERTLVVVMGEIGRTPRINGNAGRDHWEFCYTVVMAGGGVKAGNVFGASDKRGAYPNDRPVTASDIVATIYHALGIPMDFEIHDKQSRPMMLIPDGTPVRDVFA